MIKPAKEKMKNNTRIILNTLLEKGPIYFKDCDKTSLDYLTYLSEKYEWYIKNEKNKRFYYNWEQTKNINPLTCPDIKLKYFYHWKFPHITFFKKKLKNVKTVSSNQFVMEDVPMNHIPFLGTWQKNHFIVNLENGYLISYELI